MSTALIGSVLGSWVPIDYLAPTPSRSASRTHAELYARAASALALAAPPNSHAQQVALECWRLVANRWPLVERAVQRALYVLEGRQ